MVFYSISNAFSFFLHQQDTKLASSENIKCQYKKHKDVSIEIAVMINGLAIFQMLDCVNSTDDMSVIFLKCDWY